jgi:hypothetical protein
LNVKSYGRSSTLIGCGLGSQADRARSEPDPTDDTSGVFGIYDLHAFNAASVRLGAPRQT